MLARVFVIASLIFADGSMFTARTDNRTDMWTDNRTDGRADKPDNFCDGSEFSAQPLGGQ